MHSKKLYVWENGSVDEKAILLLCGEADIKLPAQSISLDRKIRYQATSKAAMSLKILRGQFQHLFQLRMKSPDTALSGEDAVWWELIEGTLKKEDAEADKAKQSVLPKMTIR